MIKLRQICKSYQTDNRQFHALDHVDVHIQPAEIYGLIGSSGAGKSTLLRCINLLERPTSGSVIVNSIDLTHLKPDQLRAQRQKIGMIFQHFNLLNSRTVFANIALPLELLGIPNDNIEEKVKSLLELVGLPDKQHHYPSQLSGGQKQRVGIARALASDPHILLCDEATSALDAEATKSILNLLKRINREFGLTIVLITHELDVVKQICDRVGVMTGGKIVEQDTTLNIFSRPQHSITKQLLDHHHPLPISANDNTEQLIVKLTFVGSDSEKPVISSLIRDYNITVNIQQALIENIQDTIVGFTICEITGDASAIQQAFQYINTTSVHLEVLHGAA